MKICTTKLCKKKHHEKGKMNKNWLYPRLGLIVVVFLFIIPFVVGYKMPQIYPESAFINERPQYEGYDRHSQMYGLKFMPPFGADATCGFDMFLFGYWIILLIIGGIFYCEL